METRQIVETAREFLLSNGRLLERRRFAYLFEDGPREPVLAALAAYQNPDGGFGNALEPDKRCADSQPIDQEVALSVLEEIGPDEAMVAHMCHWLQATSTQEGGVPFTLPTARSAPRAPWWDTDEERPRANINPTASIAGLLYGLGGQHPWLEPAARYCWRQIEESEEFEMHEIQCVLTFLRHAPERERARREISRIGEWVKRSGVVALDPNAEGYVCRPLGLAPHPAHPARCFFDDAVIAAHLDALASGQREDGGWAISWPAVTPACELEYRGMMTLAAIKTLRAYGRI
jgi:hypothetical protein